MSQNRNDKPIAGSNPGQEYDRGQSSSTTPKEDKGRLFVRTKGGSVLLTQTDKTFGEGNGHRNRS